MFSLDDLTHIYVPVGYEYPRKVFDNTVRTLRGLERDKLCQDQSSLPNAQALTYATDWAVCVLMVSGKRLLRAQLHPPTHDRAP